MQTLLLQQEKKLSNIYMQVMLFSFPIMLCLHVHINFEAFSLGIRLIINLIPKEKAKWPLIEKIVIYSPAKSSHSAYAVLDLSKDAWFKP